MPEAFKPGCKRPTSGPAGAPKEASEAEVTQKPETEKKTMVMVGRKAPDFVAPAYLNSNFVTDCPRQLSGGGEGLLRQRRFPLDCFGKVNGKTDGWLCTDSKATYGYHADPQQIPLPLHITGACIDMQTRSFYQKKPSSR
jgi:hypothetical protein